MRAAAEGQLVPAPATLHDLVQGELETVLRDPERVAALRQTALLDTPPDEAFDRLARLAARLLSAPVALVSLVDEDRQFFKSCIGLGEPWSTLRETPLSHSFCQHAVAARAPFVVEDARTHPLVSDNLAIGDLGVVAYAGIPLMGSEGHVIGTLCVIDDEPRQWTASDVSTLVDLAAAVVTESELRAAVAAAAGRERRRALLLEAGPLLAASLDEQETLERLAKLVVPRLADWCVVKTFHGNARLASVAVAHVDEMKQAAIAGFLDPYYAQADHPAGAFVSDGAPLLLESIPDQFLESLADESESLKFLRSLEIGSAIVAPLRARGRALGVFVLVRDDSDNRFGPIDLQLADLIAQRAALAIDNARLFSELDSERRRLHRVLEGMREGVVAVDRDLLVRFVNQAARRMHGFGGLETDAPLPDPWPDLSLRAFAGKLFAADARELHAHHAPTQDASYSVVGFPAQMADEAVLVFTDLSEVSRREQAEREFVTNAAHELRTPLTAISSAIEVLQSGAKDIAEDRNVFLADIEREAARLRRLTRGLLLLAEIQTQKEPPTLEEFDLHAVLEDVAAGMHKRDGVAVEVSCEPGLRAVTNPDLAAQALASIAANAAKYTLAGRICLSGSVDANGATIVVDDTGPGIAPEARERLFERFYRGGERDRDGFGLGLSIAGQAIESLGGAIEVHPSAEGGTRVEVRLPSPRP